MDRKIVPNQDEGADAMKRKQVQSTWGIYLGICLAHIGNFIYVPHLVSSLGMSRSGAWAGVVVSMMYVGRLLASLLAGGLAERYGRKRVIVLGILAEALAILGFGLTHHVLAYTALALVVGLGSGASFPGLKATLSEVPEAERPRAFSGLQVAMQIGIIVGAVLGGVITQHNSRTMFLGVFVLFLGYSAAVALFTEPDARIRKEALPGPILRLTPPSKWSVWPYFGPFVVSSMFWFLYIQFVIGIPLHISWLTPQLSVSTPFWITGLMTLLVQVHLYQYVSKRMGDLTLMLIGLCFILAAFLMLGFGHTALWVIVGSMTIVFGEMLFIPSFDIWVSSKAAEQQGGNVDRAMGTMHFFRSAGNLAGACSAGLTFDLARHTHIPGLNWLLMAGVSGLCIAYLYSLNVPRRSPASTKGRV
jgi:MFS transporter, DHA1 family, multidrug resistance protein